MVISNRNVSVKWKHAILEQAHQLCYGGYDRYDYNINSDKDRLNAYKMKFDINQYNFKSDFNYYINANHTVDFGVSSIRYRLHPGSFMNPAAKNRWS